jgi:hypothetical protein
MYPSRKHPVYQSPFPHTDKRNITSLTVSDDCFHYDEKKKCYQHEQNRVIKALFVLAISDIVQSLTTLKRIQCLNKAVNSLAPRTHKIQCLHGSLNYKELWSIKTAYDRLDQRNGNAVDSYSRDARYEFEVVHRLFWLKFLVIFLSPSGKLPW